MMPLNLMEGMTHDATQWNKANLMEVSTITVK